MGGLFFSDRKCRIERLTSNHLLDDMMTMSHKEFLIVKDEKLLRARRKYGLGFFEGAAIFQNDITEEDVPVLLTETLSWSFRFRKILGGAPNGPIHRYRPELMGEIGSFRHIHKKARKDSIEIQGPCWISEGIHPWWEVGQRKILADQEGAVAKGERRHRSRFDLGVAEYRRTAMTRKELHVQNMRVGVDFAGE
jgi:hypothetical protein